MSATERFGIIMLFIALAYDRFDKLTCPSSVVDFFGGLNLKLLNLSSLYCSKMLLVAFSKVFTVDSILSFPEMILIYFCSS